MTICLFLFILSSLFVLHDYVCVFVMNNGCKPIHYLHTCAIVSYMYPPVRLRMCASTHASVSLEPFVKYYLHLCISFNIYGFYLIITLFNLSAFHCSDYWKLSVTLYWHFVCQLLWWVYTFITHGTLTFTLKHVKSYSFSLRCFPRMLLNVV